MKKFLRLLVVPLVAGLLLVATAAPAFASHAPGEPPVSDDVHILSCTNQKNAVEKAKAVAGAPTEVINQQIEFYNSHCGADTGVVAPL